MKVIHVISRMNVGGTATYLNCLLNELGYLGVDSTLLYGETRRPEAEAKILVQKRIKVQSLQRTLNPIKDFLAFWRIKKLLGQVKPDLIHTHAFKAGLLVALLRPSIPWVHTFHGNHFTDPEFSGLKGKLLTLLERIYAKNVDFVICSGEKTRQGLLDAKIVKSQNSKSVLTGVPKFQITSSRVIASRNLAINLSKEKSILWMGRFTQVKNPKMFLNIARMNPTEEFLMAGSGELEDELKKSAPQNLKFVGWSDKQDLFAVSKFLVLTSESEGLPIALVEAQMAGLPVIATNVGSVTEIVDHGVTGFVVSKDLEVINYAISLLCEDQRLLRGMAQHSKIRARRKFNLKVMAKEHLNVYRKLI